MCVSAWNYILYSRLEKISSAPLVKRKICLKKHHEMSGTPGINKRFIQTFFQGGRKKDVGIKMAVDFYRAILEANGTMLSKEGH